MNITDCGCRHRKLFRSSNTYFIRTTWMCVLNWVGVSVWTNLHRVVRRSLILISVRHHRGAVEGRRRANTRWSLMCQSWGVMCERGANHSWAWRILISPTADCLRPCELPASFHDHHLRHLWDQTGCGDPISGPHGRRYRGDFTPETVTRCYFHPCRGRQRMKESLWRWRRRK